MNDPRIFLPFSPGQADPASSILAPHPVPWSDLAAFRETFLVYVSSPAQADALRGLGQQWAQWTLESLAVGAELPGELIRREAQAAVRELRFVEGFLSHSVGSGWREMDLPAAEHHLSREADRLSLQVQAIAEALEALLKRP